MPSKRLIIIGGGIAGLAAAYRARHSPDAEVVLLERGARLGGKIITDRIDGFVIEGGPDSFLSSKPRGVGLAEEVGLGTRLQGTIPTSRRTYVVHQGRLHDLPEGLSGLVPARLEPLLRSAIFSPEGKARLQNEYAIPPGTEPDESLASFMSRRFGPEVYERLIEPLMAGIYAGDGSALSLAATFPQLQRLEREHGSLLTAMSASRPTTTRPAFLTFPTGMAELTEALHAGLRGVTVRLGTAVAGVSQGRRYRVTVAGGAVIEADGLIVATPAPTAARLLEPLDRDLSTELAAMPAVSSATISLAFRSEELPGPLEGYGYVVPRAEGRPSLAATWVSSKFPHRAPPGYALLRVFLGRTGQEDVLNADNATLTELARQELRDLMGITAAPVLTRIFRWPQAMPQYTLGHLQRLGRIEAARANHPGLFLAGQSYRGVGIPDCIQSGEQAAHDWLASQTG